MDRSHDNMKHNTNRKNTSKKHEEILYACICIHIYVYQYHMRIIPGKKSFFPLILSQFWYFCVVFDVLRQFLSSDDVGNQLPGCQLFSRYDAYMFLCIILILFFAFFIFFNLNTKPTSSQLLCHIWHATTII